MRLDRLYSADKQLRITSRDVQVLVDSWITHTAEERCSVKTVIGCEDDIYVTSMYAAKSYPKG